MQAVADSRKWIDGKETTPWYFENFTLQKGRHYLLPGCINWHQKRKEKKKKVEIQISLPEILFGWIF